MIDWRIAASDAGRRSTVRGPFALGGVPLALAAEQAEEHAATFLGLPLWLWSLVNLVLFLGVMLYFVARPRAAMFRKRQLEVEEQLEQAKALRAEAARLEAQVHERMVRLDQEIVEIRARGLAEGEAETADVARELLAGEINEEDRRRLLEESIARLAEKKHAEDAGS